MWYLLLLLLRTVDKTASLRIDTCSDAVGSWYVKQVSGPDGYDLYAPDSDTLWRVTLSALTMGRYTSLTVRYEAGRRFVGLGLRFR